MTRDRLIHVGTETLRAVVESPPRPRGVIVNAFGDGTSHASPRNAFVAGVLRHAGFATVCVDLLTPAEDAEDVVTRELRFDIPFLAARLAAVVHWTKQQPETRALPVSLFSASTGAAAALLVASTHADIAAVVSRGGRPDLVEDCLHAVRAPTLLVVGANDAEVLHLNERAHARLHCEKRLAIVSGATHLFDEDGALEEVAALAARWFCAHIHAPDTAATDANDASDATKRAPENAGGVVELFEGVVEGAA